MCSALMCLLLPESWVIAAPVATWAGAAGAGEAGPGAAFQNVRIHRSNGNGVFRYKVYNIIDLYAEHWQCPIVSCTKRLDVYIWEKSMIFDVVGA